MFDNIVNELVSRVSTDNLWLKDILKILFANEELKTKFINEIRRSTIIWQITNEALLKSGIKEKCKILAIWDIKYFWDLENKWNKLIKNALGNINTENLTWYDLTSQWSSELRVRLKEYMWMYYNLQLINQNITSNIVLSYWWTDAFVTVLDSIKSFFPKNKINFIFPEASFMANVKIAENILWESSLLKINKPIWNNFFFTKNQFKENTLWIDDINIYYITTVWNPTWQKLDNLNLIEILEYISSQHNSIIILDNVYVGLLRNEISSLMFDKIFSNPNIMKHIIFIESLSKTLGATGIRIWWSWSVNDWYIGEIKKTTILKKAWFSKLLNELGINLLSDLWKIEEFQNLVYDYWSSQRLKFINFIKNNFQCYFDFNNSPEVQDREGIYVFLKVKDWYKIEDIFAETWIIGVWINLSDWLYIRYAFGNVNYY